MTDYKKKIVIYTDGGARGNPGPAGIGVVVYQDGVIIKKHRAFIGEKTNNEAEYEAVIAAMELVPELIQEQSDLEFMMDSELVVRQLNGIYKVKKANLQTLVIRLQKLAAKFKSVKYKHIPREKNKLADQLVNEAIDEND